MKKENKVVDFIKIYKISLIILLVVIIALVIGLIVSDFGKEKVDVAKNESSKTIANTHENVIKEETYEGLKLQTFL